MTQMKISETAKRKYNIESGKYWTPSQMGSAIYAFNMVDFDKMEEFRGFIVSLGMRVVETKGLTVYAR